MNWRCNCGLAVVITGPHLVVVFCHNGTASSELSIHECQFSYLRSFYNSPWTLSFSWHWNLTFSMRAQPLPDKCMSSWRWLEIVCYCAMGAVVVHENLRIVKKVEISKISFPVFFSVSLQDNMKNAVFQILSRKSKQFWKKIWFPLSLSWIHVEQFITSLSWL